MWTMLMSNIQRYLTWHMLSNQAKRTLQQQEELDTRARNLGLDEMDRMALFGIASALAHRYPASYYDIAQLFLDKVAAGNDLQKIIDLWKEQNDGRSASDNRS